MPSVPLTERLRALPRYEPVRTHINEERLYTTPVGSFPSVTTILSGSRDNSGLEQWRESVGHERADFISSFACFRGEGHHLNVERYLTDGTEPEFNYAFHPYWKSTRAFLDTVAAPLLLEGAIWHPDGFAGTLDCISLPSRGRPPANPARLENRGYAAQTRQDLRLFAAVCCIHRRRELRLRPHRVCTSPRPRSSSRLLTLRRRSRHLDARALEQLYKHFLARLKRFTFAKSRKRK